MRLLILLLTQLFLTQLKCASASASASSTRTNLPLEQFPRIVVAYQSWNQCDESVYQHVLNGANIIIWFKTDMISESSDGVLEPVAAFTQGPNRTCVEDTIARLAIMGHDRSRVKHLISVGGWDAAHPDTSHTAAEYYDAFQAFNGATGSGSNTGRLYDGLDWDLEGNDVMNAPTNYFTVDCLELMAELSNLLHADGYIVSMAPPESYLDVQTSEFSQSVALTYPTDIWNDGKPEFTLHGRNAYAYPLAKYPDAFDFVSFQMYETRSHAFYNTTVLGTSQVEYAMAYIERLFTDGIVVDFTDSAFAFLGKQTLDLTDRVVVGLLAKRVESDVVPLTAKNLTSAIQRLEARGSERVRGGMYWCIRDDPEGLVASVMGDFFGTKTTNDSTSIS